VINAQLLTMSGKIEAGSKSASNCCKIGSSFATPSSLPYEKLVVASAKAARQATTAGYKVELLPYSRPSQCLPVPGSISPAAFRQLHDRPQSAAAAASVQLTAACVSNAGGRVFLGVGQILRQS
jgi:hypothetical protein